MNKSGLEEFIAAYKEKRCLWDIKSPNYNNRTVRNEALVELCSILKKYDETANVASVRKKIDTIRTSYFRERKKVLSSIFAGNSSSDGVGIYVPSLWYYDQLNFISNIQDAASARAIIGVEENNEDSREFSTLTPQNKSKFNNNINYNKNNSINKKRKINNFVDLPSQDDYNKMDEFEAFGRMVEIELRKMKNPEQSIAQKLISDIIFYSKVGKLTMNSYIANEEDEPIYLKSNYDNRKNNCETNQRNNYESDHDSQEIIQDEIID